LFDSESIQSLMLNLLTKLKTSRSWKKIAVIKSTNVFFFYQISKMICGIIYHALHIL